MFKTFEECFTAIKNYHGPTERKVYHSGRNDHFTSVQQTD